MKHRLQGIVMGLIIGVALSMTAAFASGSTPIDVYFKQLVFKFDGVEKKTEQPSFIYEGSTYVPIRFVSEALGIPVHYNGETETISIGVRYNTPPEMAIDLEKRYTAKLTTNKGSFAIELFAKDAPKTVNNFVFLAREGFYEEVIFHRIMQSFMIQGGDPTGTGRGGPGYRFEDELDNGHRYERGIVGMANAGPNTNGSQFFICTGPDCELLNGQPNYTIFGKVSEGMDVVDAIAATSVTADAFGQLSSPEEQIVIERVEIIEE